MASVNYKPGTFARFFKAVKGRLVSRFGTQRYGTRKQPMFRNAAIIGGRRPPMKETDKRHREISPLSARPCNPAELNFEMVVAITHKEAVKYRREYNRAVRGGDIIEVEERDYIQWLELDAKRAGEAKERQKALVEERAKAEEKAAAEKAQRAGAAAKKAAKKSRKKAEENE
ncbi:MAG: hypothetical protein V3W41_22020 [Planctomycetota bacterium]